MSTDGQSQHGEVTVSETMGLVVSCEAASMLSSDYAMGMRFSRAKLMKPLLPFLPFVDPFLQRHPIIY